MGTEHAPEKLEAPVAEAPALEAPEIEAPEIEAPEIEAPEIEALMLEARAFEASALEAPALEAPEIEAPALEALALESLVREVLFSLGDPSLRSLQPLWPPSLPTRAATEAAGWMPVLDWLPAIAVQSHGFAAALIDRFCRIAPSLVWAQTYSTAEIGAEFLRNYAYTEIVGPNASRESASIACGFLLLGPHTLYPMHRHEAEEFYVTLSGNAEWLQGDAVWRERAPGTVVHHSSEEAHAMRTKERPLLALYVWRGCDLNQRARLDPISTSLAGGTA